LNVFRLASLFVATTLLRGVARNRHVAWRRGSLTDQRFASVPGATCLGFPLAPLLFRGMQQGIDFVGHQPSPGAERQIAELDSADGDSLEGEHLVADAGENPPNLAVAAFIQHDHEIGALAVLLFDGD